MGMQLPSSGTDDPEVMADINTTPLIDVMLVLLIMMIITIPIQLHSVNVDLPTPSTQSAPPLDPQVVKIDVDADSTVYWNGEALPDATVLERKLGEVAAADVALQPEVHLRPDRLSRYEVVAGVMAAIQRHGLSKFGIVGSEQFLQP